MYSVKLSIVPITTQTLSSLIWIDLINSFFFYSVYNAENTRHFPEGHETIAVTVDGRSGDLSGGGKYPIYLTVKRGFTHGYNSSTAVTKLAVIIEGKVRTLYWSNYFAKQNLLYTLQAFGIMCTCTLHVLNCIHVYMFFLYIHVLVYMYTCIQVLLWCMYLYACTCLV